MKQTKTLIISDIHLLNDNSKKYELFIKFCNQCLTEADELFILGDLFEVWLGDDLSIDHNLGIINTLKKISKDIKIFIMVGNRDFLLGSNFEKKSGCVLIKEPYVLERNNNKYVLIHGDSLCTKDINYQKMKKILQHPIIKFIFLHLPKKLRLKIGKKLRFQSIKATQQKSNDIMDVDENTVKKFMQKYNNTDLIHGHTHKKNTHNYDNYKRYVLGDWSNESGNAIKITNTLSRTEIN
jgi:UDP-2,3-diacylglucosamine hydrolase